MDQRYYSGTIEPEQLGRTLVQNFLSRGYESQMLGVGNQVIIQIRQGGQFATLVGMGVALAVQIEKWANGLLVTLGQQSWADKAAAGAVGIVGSAFIPIFWPLAVTAGIGAIRQSNLSNDVWVVVERSIFALGGAQSAPPSQPSSAVPTIYCTSCGSANGLHDRFCRGCGQSLQVQAAQPPVGTYTGQQVPNSSSTPSVAPAATPPPPPPPATQPHPPVSRATVRMDAPPPIPATPPAAAPPPPSFKMGTFMTSTGHTIPLNKQEMLIGRSDEESSFTPDIDLTDEDTGMKASRRHARVARMGDEYFLEDLNSTNKSSLNGTQLNPKERYPLKDGDTVVFGDVALTFKQP